MSFYVFLIGVFVGWSFSSLPHERYTLFIFVEFSQMFSTVNVKQTSGYISKLNDWKYID